MARPLAAQRDEIPCYRNTQSRAPSSGRLPVFNEAGVRLSRNTGGRIPRRQDPAVASYEAGANLPRNTWWREFVLDGSSGSFNEAGARIPRNTSARGASACRSSTSFNEAGARIPRNTVAQTGLDRLFRVASMRPGQGYPGTHRRWSTERTPYLRASMRPGQGYPGTPGECLRPMQADFASMRPGQGYPGTRCGARRRRGRPRGFNEAGARIPRNTAKPRTAAASRRWLQ